MTECECLAKCPFIHKRVGSMPATAQLYRDKYCLSDNSKCARYQVFKVLGADGVPFDLFPNQVERVSVLIAKPPAS
jgi:hypothetical protein